MAAGRHRRPPNEEYPLARQNYSYQKRQKELAKKRKKEEKRQRKLAKRNADEETGGAEATMDSDADGTAGEEE